MRCATAVHMDPWLRRRTIAALAGILEVRDGVARDEAWREARRRLQEYDEAAGPIEAMLAEVEGNAHPKALAVRDACHAALRAAIEATYGDLLAEPA